jgi:hypothetical protein
MILRESMDPPLTRSPWTENDLSFEFRRRNLSMISMVPAFAVSDYLPAGKIAAMTQVTSSLRDLNSPIICLKTTILNTVLDVTRLSRTEEISLVRSA